MSTATDHLVVRQSLTGDAIMHVALDWYLDAPTFHETLSGIGFALDGVAVDSLQLPNLRERSR